MYVPIGSDLPDDDIVAIEDEIVEHGCPQHQELKGGRCVDIQGGCRDGFELRLSPAGQRLCYRCPSGATLRRDFQEQYGWTCQCPSGHVVVGRSCVPGSGGQQSAPPDVGETGLATASAGKIGMVVLALGAGVLITRAMMG